jgi:hypothetical protein
MGPGRPAPSDSRRRAVAFAPEPVPEIPTSLGLPTDEDSGAGDDGSTVSSHSNALSFAAHDAGGAAPGSRALLARTLRGRASLDTMLIFTALLRAADDAVTSAGGPNGARASNAGPSARLERIESGEPLPVVAADGPPGVWHARAGAAAAPSVGGQAPGPSGHGTAAAARAQEQKLGPWLVGRGSGPGPGGGPDSRSAGGVVARPGSLDALASGPPDAEPGFASPRTRDTASGLGSGGGGASSRNSLQRSQPANSDARLAKVRPRRAPAQRSRALALRAALCTLQGPCAATREASRLGREAWVEAAAAPAGHCSTQTRPCGPRRRLSSNASRV